MPSALVVDDEPDIRQLVALALELDGWEVASVADGQAALDRLESGEVPDVVVLDVMMPGIDGWEVLDRVKAMAGPVGEVPVVLLTARTGDLDRVRGGIGGAVRYLTKPFVVDDLLAELRSAVGGEPERVQRRRAQQGALEHLALLEKGGGHTLAEAPAGPRPRLSRLERRPAPAAAPSVPRAVEGALLDQLSDKQRELVASIASTPTVVEAADRLGVSRSNVYASLKRIARRLGVASVEEVVRLARAGQLTSPAGDAAGDVTGDVAGGAVPGPPPAT